LRFYNRSLFERCFHRQRRSTAFIPNLSVPAPLLPIVSAKSTSDFLPLSFLLTSRRSISGKKGVAAVEHLLVFLDVPTGPEGFRRPTQHRRVTMRMPLLCHAFFVRVQAFDFVDLSFLSGGSSLPFFFLPRGAFVETHTFQNLAMVLVSQLGSHS